MGRSVQAGDSLRGNIGAGDWNAVRQFRNRNATQQTNMTGGEPTSDSLDGIVIVKNTTSNPFDVGDVVGLDSPFITAASNLGEYKTIPNFNAVVPTDGTAIPPSESPTTDYTGRFGILLDGCAPGKLAPARVSDVTWARLYMNAATDQFADITHNNKTYLTSGSSGSAQILDHYAQSATYPQETIGRVRLGNKVPVAYGGFGNSWFTDSSFAAQSGGYANGDGGLDETFRYLNWSQTTVPFSGITPTYGSTVAAGDHLQFASPGMYMAHFGTTVSRGNSSVVDSLCDFRFSGTGLTIATTDYCIFTIEGNYSPHSDYNVRSSLTALISVTEVPGKLWVQGKHSGSYPALQVASIACVVGSFSAWKIG